ncbi:hypothetical protein M3Y99_00309400 [Aphelenchoides fujianensis]|nr:hypothetical protein M3Y99_00309400 [Aphelenchoides fujianensis]
MSVMARPPVDWTNWYMKEEDLCPKPLKRPHKATENGALNGDSQNLPQISPAVPLPSVSNADPLMISLQEDESPSKRSIKAGSIKDPKSGLTMDTVKRRRLCDRFGQLYNNRGVFYHTGHFPKLTNIQVGGLLRRSRNRQELVELSDTMWDHVYEEKRRYDARYDDGATGDENLTKEFFRDLRQMKQMDDEHEATDVSDQEDDFELADVNLMGEQAYESNGRTFKSWNKVQGFYELRRALIQTDHWLCLMKRSVLERRAKMRSFYDKYQRTRTSYLLPSEVPQANSQCARCIPLNKNHRRKLVKFDAPSAFPTDRIHPIGLVDDRKESRAKEADSDDAKEFSSSGGSGGSKKKSSSSGKLRLDRDATLQLLDMAAKAESAIERKNLEESLHRHSSGYVYSEIAIPHFRCFRLDDHEEPDGEDELSPKSSDDSLKSSSCNPTEIDDFQLEENEALHFGEVHHRIEFPKYTEEELRIRWSNHWVYTPEHAPYNPLDYQHEDPRIAEFKYCAFNPEVPPYPALFPPCLKSSACTSVHHEPRLLAPVKQEGTKGFEFCPNAPFFDLPSIESPK